MKGDNWKDKKRTKKKEREREREYERERDERGVGFIEKELIIHRVYIVYIVEV